MLCVFCSHQYPVDTILFFKCPVWHLFVSNDVCLTLIFSSDVQLTLCITDYTNLYNHSGPPFPDHFEAPPNQFHCGPPLEPPPGPCSGWSMPHRRSKYPPDSRQTMEPPVSNGGGVLFHISFFCPYGVIILHHHIFTICWESQWATVFVLCALQAEC